MSEGPRYLTVGTVNGGSTAIRADMISLGSDTAVQVRLTTDYTTVNPRPPGYPTRPSLTGVDPNDLDFPKTIPSGTLLGVLRCEAAALVGAAAAIYA